MEPLVKSVRKFVRSRSSTRQLQEVEKQSPAISEAPLLQINGRPTSMSSIHPSVSRGLSSESFSEIIHPLHRCLERSSSGRDIPHPGLISDSTSFLGTEYTEGRPSILKRMTTAFSSSRLSLQRPSSALLRNSSAPSLARVSNLEGMPCQAGPEHPAVSMINQPGEKWDTSLERGRLLFGSPPQSSTPSRSSPSDMA